MAARAENRCFLMFSAHGKICLKLPEMGSRVVCVPTNADLANMWGNKDFDLDNLYLSDLLDPRCSDSTHHGFSSFGPAGRRSVGRISMSLSVSALIIAAQSKDVHKC